MCRGLGVPWREGGIPDHPPPPATPAWIGAVSVRPVPRGARSTGVSGDLTHLDHRPVSPTCLCFPCDSLSTSGAENLPRPVSTVSMVSSTENTQISVQKTSQRLPEGQDRGCPCSSAPRAACCVSEQAHATGRTAMETGPLSGGPSCPRRSRLRAKGGRRQPIKEKITYCDITQPHAVLSHLRAGNCDLGI